MLNAKVNAETKNLHFQDFVTSSQKLDTGRAVEVPFAGPYTAARYIVISRELADCGTVHNFVARPA